VIVTDTTKTIHVSQFPDGRLDRNNAAAYTGFSAKTLAMHACTGTGPKFVKIGGRVFYRKADLDDWLGSFPAVTSTAQARAAHASA
jgi:predicted DNA-binding transcriptional regulator AlpA